MKKYLLFLLMIPLYQYRGYAQNITCGCPKSTDAQINQIEAMMLNIKQKMALSANASITYIPIQPHFIRKSDGTGGMDLGAFNDAIATANSYFVNANIQFYLCGTSPHYIDDDNFYNFDNRTNANWSLTEFNLRNHFSYSNNAINLYCINYFLSDGIYQENSGIGGYSKTPANSISGTVYSNQNNSNIIVLRNSFITRKDNYRTKVIVHELGHYFNLYHTFQNDNSTNIALRELVTRGAGANCTTKGDWLCDTPADPFEFLNFADYDNNTCSYIGKLKDANGELYSPDMTNVMSYYLCPTQKFTQGQYDRLKAGLVLRTSPLPVGDVDSYTLDCPPTVVTAPSNCLILKMPITNYIPTIIWQDNSTNETGFIIERSSSPTDGFVAVGGVGPSNGTGAMVSFTDNSFVVGSVNTCYYRVKPSNTTTTYSNVAAFQSNSKCSGSLTVGDVSAQIPIVTYEAGSIIATGTLSAKAISFSASTSIELKTGFNTIAGNSVTINTAPCTSATRQGIAEEPKQAIPTLEAYPNPTTDRVTINYEVNEAEAGSEVIVFLTTDMGKTIGTLVHDEHHEAGTFSINYSTQHLPEGMYIYSISTNGRLQSKRLVISK
jgi:Pregnancy-associated plasma protein-A/Secretion system C-terminal sorting domain